METIEKTPITSKMDMHGWSNDEKLERTEFFVEATSFEFRALWSEHFYDKDENDRLEWIQDGSGFARYIGRIGKAKNKRDVYVNFSFYAIGGKYICFYYSDGRYQDWDQIDAFIEKIAPKYDNGQRIAKCDANNFHNCLWFCKE